MSAATCLFPAAVSLSLPSTSTPASAGRRCLRSPTALLRCSPTRRRGPVRALDERLLEAAPAETEEVQTGVDVGDGGGVAEGDGVGAEEVEEELELEQQRPPPRAFVKSRRQRQEEEDAAAGQDRFKLINGKEVAACVASAALLLWFGRPD
jgi:GTP-binding protein HflX